MNESQWLEKKRHYELNNEFYWLEFIRDILSASNSKSKKSIGIFIGIDDKSGEFYTTSLPDEAEIRQKIQSLIDPLFRYVILPLWYPNSKTGYVIAIQPTENVYSFKKDWKNNNNKILAYKGEVWVRNVSRKMKLEPTEALHYQKEKIMYHKS